MPKKEALQLGRVRHVHFVGIGGIGMSGIAEVLYNLGYEVSGSDIREGGTTQRLQQLGINVDCGHEASHVNGSDVVVISSAVTEDNPEVQAARRKRIPIVPRAEMLAELMRFRYGIAVAGTHGKTTTTSLIASLLAEANLDPTYVIGGRLISSGANARLGDGKYLVAEADESDASFLHLQPVLAVLTNIDRDHLGAYENSYETLKKGFLQFVQQLPFYGLGVACLDDPGVREILAGISKPIVTYGIEQDADLVAHSIRSEARASLFTVATSKNPEWMKVQLGLPGRHNVLNALAAIAIGREIGIDEQTMMRALRGFKGITRRFEHLGEIQIRDKSVLVVDDYGHHPAEIEATFSAARDAWPERRLVVVFEPHRYTRTRDLFDEFCQVLGKVDALLMLKVYPAGEKPIAGADSKSLCRAIRLLGRTEALYVNSMDELHSVLPNLLNDHDVLLLLGAGDIGTLGRRLLQEYGQAPRSE